MDDKWEPVCACGEKFDNMRDFRVHLIREGGSQSHALFSALRKVNYGKSPMPTMESKNERVENL